MVACFVTPRVFVHNDPTTTEQGKTNRMFKKNKIFAILAAFVASIGATHTAHAGLRDWLNDVTTFNEDQKRPFNKYPTAPRAPGLFYDAKSGDDWSQFYTGSTQPQPYLNGSASMVVRAPQPLPEQAEASALPEPSALGYDVFARRHYLNNNQPTGNIVIGDPGMMGETTQLASAFETKPKTSIGNPKEHWRNGPSGPYITPRPGDFDYQTGARDDGRVAMAGARVGDVLPTTGGSTPAVGDPKYQGDGSTRYTVEHGDSLSGISDKSKIYGDWKLWPLLYDANRGTIGNDPDFIKPGQNLGVPRDVTTADAQEARQHSRTKKPPHLLHDGK